MAASLDFKPYQNFVDSDSQLYYSPNLLAKQQWEPDPKLQKEIQALMLAAEKIAGVPLNRILLSCERDLGRAYSKADYYWPERKITRRVLKNKEICNQTLARAFKFALDVFNDFKPDFCFGGPTGGLENAIFYFVAKYCGVPHITCMASSIVSERHYWSNEWGSFYTGLKEVLDKKERELYPPSAASLHRVRNFRDNPEPMEVYQKMWSDKSRNINFLNINKRVLERLIHRLVPIIKGEKVLNPKPFFQMMITTYREYILKKTQKKHYSTFSDDELSKFKYIYYAFHQDPEFVLNVRAPFWYNQLNTIKMLSYNLPAGYKLIIREHRHNVGRRSNRYLKELIQYPGVILIDAYDKQYKYLKNASLIVTVNGTTGLEGLFLKKPVLLLDKAFYDVMGLAFTISNNAEFGSLILNAVDYNQFPENYDERLGRFIDAEREVTFSFDEDPGLEIKHIQNMLNRTETGVNRLEQYEVC